MKNSFDVVLFSIKSDRSGVPLYCAEMGEWLVSLGKSVCIVTKESGPAFHSLPSGVTLLEFSSLENSISLRSLISAVSVFKNVNSRYRCGTFILNGALFGTVGRFLASKISPRVIFVHHGLSFDRGFNFFRRLTFFCIELFLLNFRETVNVAISKRHYKWLEKLVFFRGRRRVHAVPNVSFRAANMDKQLSRTVVDTQNAPIRYVCVAGFRSQKNHERLFEAFEVCKVEAELFLIGVDVDSDRAIGLAQKCLCKKKFDLVRFVGVESDPCSFLTPGSVAVLASDYEGFPLVALEAAQLGSPVVMTPVSGSDELHEAGVGFIATRYTAVSLAREMEAAAAALKSGDWDRKEVAERAKTAFDTDQFFKSWYGLLFEN